MTYLATWLRQNEPEFVSLRHLIHQNPEMAYEEFGTSDLVAERLKSWGYEVTRNIGGTGVVGQLRLGTSKRTLGIRADMDALPLTELTGLPYASKNTGKMHACGHDGHTSTLLFAARYIAEQKKFDGTLNLIFQPAEEGLAGAQRMIDDGLFERFPCDAVYALHNMPGIPTGKLVFRNGAIMASGDKVVITLTGRGGHGAMPHMAVDPTVAAASIVMALQTVVSRNADPLHAAVVTVGVLKAGTASNVIPETAQLELTVRALDPAVRQMLEERIKDLVDAQARSFGVSALVDYHRGYPVLINTVPETDRAREVALELFGPEGMEANGTPLMASEDFAFMTQKVPGCYFFLGNGTEKGDGGCSIHNPHYDFNDKLLSRGAAFWARLTERLLPVLN